MLKRPKGPAGTLVVLEHSSKILKDNPLGDPHARKVAVWLPPQYDGATGRRFPVFYDLVGFTAPAFRTRAGSRSATTYRSARRG